MTTRQDRRRRRRGRNGRRRHRYTLLWRTLPLWVLAFVAGLLVLSMVGLNRSGLAHFQDGDYAASADDFGSPVHHLNVIERWKAPFNHGTALYADGRHWDALWVLEDALDLVPDDQRCMVQTNRALTLEAVADEDMEISAESADYAEQAQVFVDAGEPYPDRSPWGDMTPEELREDARMFADFAKDMYAEAIHARQDPSCSDDSQADAEQQQQNQASVDRLEDKEQEAAEAAQDEEQEREQPKPSSPEDAEQQRRQELGQRNAEAEAEADAERQQRASAGDPGGAGGGTGAGTGGDDQGTSGGSGTGTDGQGGQSTGGGGDGSGATGGGGGDQTGGGTDGSGSAGGGGQGDQAGGGGSGDDQGGGSDGEGDGAGGGTKNW